MILSYIEQTSLYNAYNFSQPSSNSAWYPPTVDGGPVNSFLMGSSVVNTTVVGSMVASYVCPSDAFPSAIHPNDANTTGTGPYSMQFARESNYLLNTASYTEYSCPGWPGGKSQGFPTPVFRGPFFNDMSTGLNDIKDGTSNTLLCGESVQSPGHYSNLYGPYWGSGTHTSTHGYILYAQHANAPATLPNGYTSYFGYTTGNPKLPYAWVFSSYHPGGVNMAMCDGSVRFFKNSISVYAWASLASIAGNEVISSDSN